MDKMINLDNLSKYDTLLKAYIDSKIPRVLYISDHVIKQDSTAEDYTLDLEEIINFGVGNYTLIKDIHVTQLYVGAICTLQYNSPNSFIRILENADTTESEYIVQFYGLTSDSLEGTTLVTIYCNKTSYEIKKIICTDYLGDETALFDSSQEPGGIQ